MEKQKNATGLSGQELYEDVIRYSRMGDHRTGGPADLKTSEWIKRELSAAGYRTETLTWNLRQFFIEKCRVEVFGHRINAFPLWYPMATGPEPIRNRLAAIENIEDRRASAGKTALIQFDDDMVTHRSRHEAIIHQLAEAGARAVIGYFPHPLGELFGHNAISPFNQCAWPIPVAMIAAKDRHILDQAAALEHEVGLLIDGRDEPWAEAGNVIARLDRGKPWIIVSTPQSGWFRSAGERGAGLALFLGLARWAGRESSGPSYLFLSNSGHELGHLGMHHSFERGEIPPPDQVICWLHLGASIAARRWVQAGPFLKHDEGFEKAWLGGSPDLLPLLTDCFRELPHLVPQAYTMKRGEFRWILEKGYPGFTLLGGHRFFHLPSDGPEATAPDLLEAVAQAVAQALQSIGRPGFSPDRPGGETSAFSGPAGNGT